MTSREWIRNIYTNWSGLIAILNIVMASTGQFTSMVHYVLCIYMCPENVYVTIKISQ